MGSDEDNFMQVKYRPHQSYNKSSTLYLLTHLYEPYAVISNADWLANDKRFCEAYAPTNPIEVVCRQINDAVAYGDAGSTPNFPRNSWTKPTRLCSKKVYLLNTNLGCGTLRQLCLTLYPTVYATLSATRVVNPPNPGVIR